MWTTITPRMVPLLQQGADPEADITQLPGYQPEETPADYSGDVISADMGKNAPPASERSVDPILETAKKFGDIPADDEGFDPIVETAIKFGDLPATDGGPYEGIEQEVEKPQTSDEIIAAQIQGDPVFNAMMGADKAPAGPRKTRHTLQPSPVDPNTGMPVDADQQLAYDRETEEILQNKYGTGLSHLTNIPTGLAAITSSLLPGVENKERWEEAVGGFGMIAEEIPMWLSGEWAIKSLSPVAQAAGRRILKFIDTRAPFELHGSDIGAVYNKTMEGFAAARPPMDVTEQAGQRVATNVTQRIQELKNKPAEQLTHDDRAFVHNMIAPQESTTLGMGGAGRIAGPQRDPHLMGLSDGEVLAYFNKRPGQTITSGDAAVLWMKDNDLYPKLWTEMTAKEWQGYSQKAFNKANKRFLTELESNPKFQALSKFDQIRVYAAAQRPPRQRVYPKEFGLAQNAKSVGSDIYTVDTIRGCDNFCLDCYAVFGASQTQIAHAAVVKATLQGKFKPGRIYRFGTVGDPAFDWAHSVEQVKQAIARSPKEFNPDKGVYGITKLQSIDGIDTKVFRNLEVSLDPLFPDHMMIAMQNVIRLKRMDPNVNIYLRIRSFESLNPELKGSLDAAVKFAKETGLPVLETRMRWKSGGGKKGGGSFSIIEGDPTKYKRSGPQMKLKESALKDKFDPGQFSQCNTLDIMENACLKCGRCKNFVENKIGAGPVRRDPFADKPGTTLGMFYGETSTSMQAARSGDLFMEPGRAHVGDMPEGTFTPVFDKGKPRFEVSDRDADLLVPGFRKGQESRFKDPVPWLEQRLGKNPDGSMNSMPLPEMLKHDRLYYEYPFLKDTKIYYNDKLNYKAFVLPGENAIYLCRHSDEALKSDLLHEIQHLIQIKEGWAPGGNSKVARDVLNVAFENMDNEIRITRAITQGLRQMDQGLQYTKVLKALRRDQPDLMGKFEREIADGINYHLEKETPTAELVQDLAKKQKDMERILEMRKMDDHTLYKAIAGELEARGPGDRIGLTDAQLRSTDPYASRTTSPGIIVPEYNQSADWALTGGRIASERTDGKQADQLGKVSGFIQNHRGVEYVSIDDLKAFREGDRLKEHADRGSLGDRLHGGKRSPEIVKSLMRDIQDNGLSEPLEIWYDTTTRKAVLREGNHRLAALDSLGWTHAPVIVRRANLHGFGIDVKNPIGASVEDFPNWVPPSKLGFSVKSGGEGGETLGMGFAGVWERMFGKKSAKPTPAEAVQKVASSDKRLNPNDFAEVTAETLSHLEKDPNNPILNDAKRRLFLRLGEFIESDSITAAGFDAMAAKQGMTRVEFARALMEESSRAGKELNQLSQIAKRLRELHPDDAALDEVIGKGGDFWKWYRKVDNVRRQLLIGQLATAMRNIISQGARVGVEMFDDLVFGMMGLAKGEGKKSFAYLMEDFNALYRRMTPTGRARLEEMLKRFDGVNEAMLGENISDVTLTNKALSYINALNRFQEHQFRRMAFDARISALTRKKGLNPLTDEIPDWMIKDAFDHSMEMTFQRGTGKLAEAMRNAYRAFPLLTTVNPFPRFWANSVNFLIDYGPLGFSRGIYNLGKKGATDETMRQLSRGITGTLMLGGAWQLRNSEYAGEKYYEIKIGDKYIDTRAFAPFSTYLALAEILKGEKSTMTLGDMIQAFVGINRIAGTGLALLDFLKTQAVDRKSGEEISDTGKRAVADFTAQYLGGFTVPLKTIKDMLAAIDPSQGVLQSTKVDTEYAGYKSMLRPALSNVPYGNMVNEIPGMEGTVVPSTSMTRTDHIRLENPATRQLSGISYKTKSPLEQEIDKLKIENLTTKTGTPEIDRLISREVAQAGFVDEGNDLVESEYYRKLDPQEKVAEIRQLATGYKAEVRDEVKFEVYNKILTGKKSAMDRYRYIVRLVEKGRVNEDLLDDLMAEHDHGMSQTMLDKIYMTFDTKVKDPYGPMAGVNAE